MIHLTSSSTRSQLAFSCWFLLRISRFRCRFSSKLGAQCFHHRYDRYWYAGEKKRSLIYEYIDMNHSLRGPPLLPPPLALSLSYLYFSLSFSLFLSLTPPPLSHSTSLSLSICQSVNLSICVPVLMKPARPARLRANSLSSPSLPVSSVSMSPRSPMSTNSPMSSSSPMTNNAGSKNSILPQNSVSDENKRSLI